MDTLTKNIILTPFNILYKISPKFELKLMFRLKQGRKLDLDNPKSFSEKIQWIKLYDDNPLIPKCVDKYLVREYITSVGCGEILNDLLWEGYDPKEIPFDKLPKKFVIKATHGSTMNIICKDKSKLNCEEIIKQCEKFLKAKFIPCYGEWFYGVEKPRIIVERFIDSDDKEELRDYKVFCFNGEPYYIRVDSDRFSGHKTDIYTVDWNRLEGVRMKHPNTENVLPKPEGLSEMLEYARKISREFKEARVDFYISNGNIIFGEITFTSCAGFDRIMPYSFDIEMGNLLKL